MWFSLARPYAGGLFPLHYSDAICMSLLMGVCSRFEYNSNNPGVSREETIALQERFSRGECDCFLCTRYSRS